MDRNAIIEKCQALGGDLCGYETIEHLRRIYEIMEAIAISLPSRASSVSSFSSSVPVADVLPPVSSDAAVPVLPRWGIVKVDYLDFRAGDWGAGTKGVVTKREYNVLYFGYV